MVFHGSELSIGIILAAWMLWVGVGSRLGAVLYERSGRPLLVLIATAAAVLVALPATVLFVRAVRGFFDVLPGAYLSFLDMAVSCLVLMAPACLLLGAQFVMLAGIRREAAWFLEPLRWVLMSVPAVVLVVVAMLVFGLGNVMVVAITALLVSPIVYVNAASGVALVDAGILDMARVYRFPWWMRVRHVYGPAVVGSLLSGLALAVGMGVRVVILAEVMGAAEGIGHALTVSRSVLDVPALTAWVVVTVLIVGAAEYLILRPLERRATRWRR